MHFSLFTECTDEESSHKMINALAQRSKHHDATRTLTRLWKIGDYKQRNCHNLTLAFLFMLKYEESDACWVLVERVKERIHRCESAQKQAYILAIQHGAHAYEYPNRSSGATMWDHLIPLIGDSTDWRRAKSQYNAQC